MPVNGVARCLFVQALCRGPGAGLAAPSPQVIARGDRPGAVCAWAKFDDSPPPSRRQPSGSRAPAAAHRGRPAVRSRLACRGCGAPARGRRCGDAQLRQCRRRRRRARGRRAHRQELRRRPQGQGHHQHRLEPGGAPQPGLPDAPVGAAPAGLRRDRGRRHRQDRPGSGRQAARRRGRAGSPPRRRRPAGDPGADAEVRDGGAACQRAAPPDHAQQHHRRVPERQRADHHRLRRQPAAHQSHHRLARPRACGRAGADPRQARVRGRPGRDPEPARGRDAGRAGGGRRRPAAGDARRRRPLEQHSRAQRQPRTRGAHPATGRAARHAGPCRRQHLHRLSQERRGRAGCADAARVAHAAVAAVAMRAGSPAPCRGWRARPRWRRRR